MVIGHRKSLRQFRSNPFNFRFGQNESIMAVTPETAIIGPGAGQAIVEAVRRLDFKCPGRNPVHFGEILIR